MAKYCYANVILNHDLVCGRCLQGFMENAETLQEGALRETKEETQASPKITSPYTAFSLTHISQSALFLFS